MSHGETPKKIMCSIKAETRKPEGLLVMLQAVFNLKPQILNAAILGNHSKLKKLFKPSNEKGIEGGILSQVLE